MITPQAGGFGAVVTGLDLSRPLPPATLAQVRAAWAEHAVLSFPGQPLSLEQLEALTLQFGPFGEDPFIRPMPGHPNVLELRREPDETAKNFGAGWHSDWSFQARPPAGTILHGQEVPLVGGDTLFADCRRAWDSLSPAMQAMLAPLRAVHSARQAYGTQGVFARETEARAMQIVTGEAAEATQVHPLVVVHPVSGRRALFVNPVYTVGIEGMTREEGLAILRFLFERIVEARFVFRHRWAADTLLLWDNRSTLHFAEGGYDGHRRVMHRTTLAGDAPLGIGAAA
ncbi:TauD/TfdA dioxygenase family protein [Caulobacter sp. KR2-114]|uniref:TauD/TfdA dioxygenase family protein n=1 Tax=Caulobacter sp. KR2-114 TaxID=3400912 RepID=UPI003C0DE45A